ncbi:MAG: hypothetical protein D6718_03865 [Acidobacteria bacterium]|nr:MAG: hypothetical protein D6718_03865 [Acidobacteriota bacterium]
MKQLTIFCSPEHEARVVRALERIDVEGFARVGDVTGNRFQHEVEGRHTVGWQAAMFIVPGLTDAQAQSVIDELESFAGECAEKPCLRIVLSTIDALY